MKTLPSIVVVVVAFVGVHARGSRLEAICTPTPGPYQLIISPAAIPVTACPGASVAIEVRANTAAPAVAGFGFNLVINGPGTVLSVTPGFPIAGGAGFQSAVGPPGPTTTVAAFGLTAPGAGGPPALSLLATIVFQPATVGVPQSWSVDFTGTLPLPGGIVPVNHEVQTATGCDVLPTNGLGLSPGMIVLTTCPGNFIRGDCNNNGYVAGLLGDVWFILNALFLGGPLSACQKACNVDDSGILDIANAVFLLNWEILGGPAPPPPTPLSFFPPPALYLTDCGPDLTPDALTCLSGVCP